MLNSLKSRIIFTISGIIIISFIIKTVIIGYIAESKMEEAFENNAMNLLNATTNLVKVEYNSIQYSNNSMLENRKTDLKTNVKFLIKFMDSVYRGYRNRRISEDLAKEYVINYIKNLRYNEGVGYFWINDIGRPYPKMIMHPTIPELDNSILDNPEFNCALGKNENLFKAFVDSCLHDGSGFIDYYWPKPTKEGLTELQPKLSYVELYDKWNWIIGTGIYMDDLEIEKVNRIDAVVENLNEALKQQKVGEHGYLFIFTDANQILVHPTMKKSDLITFVNLETGNFLMDDLRQTVKSGKHTLEYSYGRPGFDEQKYIKDPRSNEDILVRKKAYINYFEPLGWYICSSVYIDDMKKNVNHLLHAIILFSSIFLVIAVIVSYLLSKSIVNPINKLIESLHNSDSEGFPLSSVPVVGTAEIKIFASTLNKMLNSVIESRSRLKQSEGRFRGLIESSCDLIWELNGKGEFTYISPQAFEILGYEEDELYGKKFHDILVPGDKDINPIMYGKISEFKDPIVQKEYIGVHKSGKKIILETSGLPVYNDENEMIGFRGVTRDITERKETEQFMRLVQYGVNKARDSVIWFNSETQIVYVNDAASDMLGYSKDELLKMKIPQIDSQFPLTNWEKHMTALRHAGFKKYESVFLSRDNMEIPVEITSNYLEFEGEEGAFLFVRDITLRKATENALRESESKYRGLIESSSDLIWEVNKKGLYTYVSPQIESILGYSPEEVIGKTPFDFMSESESEKIENDFTVRFRNKEVLRMLENINIHKNGNEVVLETSGVPIFSEEGEFVGYRGVDRDITQKKLQQKKIQERTEQLSKANQELLKHKEHLEELVNERTEELRDSLINLKKAQDFLIQSEKMAALGGLVAGVAHEINTPVGIGVTAASFLEVKTTEIEEKFNTNGLKKSNLKEYFSIARDSSRMLLSNMKRAADLIQSFKQVAVDQASKERRKFMMKEYMTEILASLSSKFKRSKHTISIQCEEDIEVNSFPGAFSQIMTNLIMNSLKHGFEDLEAGHINIRIERSGENVKLVYTDNGKGIPQKNLIKVFDPFFTTKRGQGGSGLGMHIVYNLVTQSLGGSITCDSVESESTEFVIDFPVDYKITDEINE